MKYDITKDGQWIQPFRKDFKIKCCDCGLVHNINFRIRKGRVQFQAFRNKRSTAQVRRNMSNIKVNNVIGREKRR